MKSTKNTAFGVVVCASSRDYLFAKGTCASIRYFMPDVPIALLLDGKADTAPLEQNYGVQVIRKKDIDQPWLRNNSFGWGITKMLAFWYTPFDRFLYLDSDTVVWGNLQDKLPWDKFDYITDIPSKASQVVAEHVRTWFFEPEIIEQNFADFPWEKYANQYACTGTFIARKNLFDVDEYRQLLDFNDRYPQTFKFGEMGILNLMLFRAHEQERINLGFEDFQVIFPDFSQIELEQRFGFEHDKPVVKSSDVQVLHMPDQKPLVNNTNCYSLPMTYFRLKFLVETEGIKGQAAMERLLQEDRQFVLQRKKSQRISRLKKIKRLLALHPGEWSYFYRNYLVKF
jgi:hypothetical protein